MNAATPACASPSLYWAGINWPEVQRQVRRLQTRIVKATQAGKHNKVKALQWLLTEYDQQSLITLYQSFKSSRSDQSQGELRLIHIIEIALTHFGKALNANRQNMAQRIHKTLFDSDDTKLPPYTRSTSTLAP